MLKQRIKVTLGVPEEIDEKRINDLKEDLMSYSFMDNELFDIDFDVERTKGAYYLDVSPIEPDITVPEEEHEKLVADDDINEVEPVDDLKDVFNIGEGFIDDDCSELCDDSSEKEKCSYSDKDKCSAYELTKFDENVALIKLYFMLNCMQSQELYTEFGSTWISESEKQFLLKTLFENTGLDKVAKKLISTLEDM